VELREYVRACRRRWVWIVVPVLLAAGAAAGLTLAREPAYRSSMVLFVTTGAGDPDAKASRLNSYIALLTGPRVAESVIAKLGLPGPAEQVQQSLSAQVQEGTDLLVVSATDPSAQRSRSIVTTATTALVALAKQLDPPNAAAGGPPPSVSIAQQPVTTREPDNLARNVAFAAVLGLLIGAAAVAVREATRKTVAEEDDLRRLGLDAVGIISLGGRSARNGANEALAEAFRRLRSLLPELAGLGGDAARGTSLLLTGPHAKEGTTAVACGLAIAMAETGSRVVLVDANLRTPGVGRYLSLEPGRGLADVLSGTARVPEVLRDSLDGRLTVLPAGEPAPDPGEILASPRLATTLRALTERFDVVLVDAPPLHGVADATVLGKATDGALLVVRANHTRTLDVERSVDLLRRVGAQLAGAVLNALPRKLPTSGPWPRPEPDQFPAPHDPDLVTQLFGDDHAPARPGAETEPPNGTDEPAGTRVPAGTVRGRAPVITVSIGTRDAEKAPAARADIVRGQARVADPPGPAAEPGPIDSSSPCQQPDSAGEPTPAEPPTPDAEPGPAAQPTPVTAGAAGPAPQPSLPAQRTPGDKPRSGE
jgi:capsular exopolysaccharide synthesis family protein